jgi:hypothetical protein
VCVKFNETVLKLALVNQPTALRSIKNMLFQPSRDILVTFSAAFNMTIKVLAGTNYFHCLANALE